MLPVGNQLLLVTQTPLLDDCSRFLWQTPLGNFSSTDLDKGLKALIFDMYVGWRMIIVPHAHNDAEEDGNNWHSGLTRVYPWP